MSNPNSKFFSSPSLISRDAKETESEVSINEVFDKEIESKSNEEKAFNKESSDSKADNNGDTPSKVHFELAGTLPVLIDGVDYDKQFLLDSLKTIQKKVKFSSPLDRNKFIMKVCRAFGLDTTSVNDCLDDESLINEIEESPNFQDNQVFPFREQSVTKFQTSDEFLNKNSFEKNAKNNLDKDFNDEQF